MALQPDSGNGIMTNENKYPEARSEMQKPLKERDGAKLPPIGASIREMQPKATSGNSPKKVPE